jgi:hypothetical protein
MQVRDRPLWMQGEQHNPCNVEKDDERILVKHGGCYWQVLYGYIVHYARIEPSWRLRWRDEADSRLQQARRLGDNMDEDLVRCCVQCPLSQMRNARRTRRTENAWEAW